LFDYKTLITALSNDLSLSIPAFIILLFLIAFSVAKSYQWSTKPSMDDIHTNPGVFVLLLFLLVLFSFGLVYFVVEPLLKELIP